MNWNYLFVMYLAAQGLYLGFGSLKNMLSYSAFPGDVHSDSSHLHRKC